MFVVATAPPTGAGHVNLSPKGLRGLIPIESKSRVCMKISVGAVRSLFRLLSPLPPVVISRRHNRAPHIPAFPHNANPAPAFFVLPLVAY